MELLRIRHPGAFVDQDGQTYLFFFLGNNDKGHAWLLSFARVGWKRVGWKNDGPYVMD